MKKLFGYLLVSAAVVFSGVWVAAEMDLTRFQPGTVISSDQVNANFDDIAIALDGMQGRVSDGCPEGSSIRVIHPDGSVSCEQDDIGPNGSSGDVTGVAAGIGLAGGGGSGDVTLRIANDYRLPQGCANGGIPEWNGAAWTCGSDDIGAGGGGGDITDVTAGEGLTGGGSTGAVTLDLDFGQAQGRVDGSCAAGSSIRAINQDGSVACEVDDVGSGGGGASGVDSVNGFTGAALYPTKVT